MKIGIIGAGNVGTALGRASVRAAHTAVMSSKETGEAARVAKKLGAREASSNQDAVAAWKLLGLNNPERRA